MGSLLQNKEESISIYVRKSYISEAWGSIINVQKVIKNFCSIKNVFVGPEDTNPEWPALTSKMLFFMFLYQESAASTTTQNY